MLLTPPILLNEKKNRFYISKINEGSHKFLILAQDPFLGYFKKAISSITVKAFEILNLSNIILTENDQVKVNPIHSEPAPNKSIVIDKFPMNKGIFPMPTQKKNPFLDVFFQKMFWYHTIHEFGLVVFDEYKKPEFKDCYIYITGHTGADEDKGDVDKQKSIGLERAIFIRDFLSANFRFEKSNNNMRRTFRFDKNIFIIDSKASTDLVRQKKKSGHEKNRRVEIHFYSELYF